jgi:hypothetical protein
VRLATLEAVPDRRRRVSDGVLVEASILARLLGIRLLTLDATLVLVPAVVSAPPRTPPRRTRAPRARPAAVGRGLAEAVRSINEGAELLDEARRDGLSTATGNRVRLSDAGRRTALLT